MADDIKICVPTTEEEQANLQALEEYLNSIYYC